MIGLAENPAMESPAHLRLLLTKTLPIILKAVLSRMYAEEPPDVILSVQDALQGAARALAKASALLSLLLFGRVFCRA